VRRGDGTARRGVARRAPDVVVMMLDVYDARLGWRRRVRVRLHVDDAGRGSRSAAAEHEAGDEQSEGLAQHAKCYASRRAGLPGAPQTAEIARIPRLGLRGS
jgi:hypothetical protein